MSKQCLDIQQMQHLKDLGVDTSNASMVCIYTDCNCDVIEWDDVMEELGHPEPMEMFKTLYDAETGDYDHSYIKYCGVFTLQDILDLLPSEIQKDGKYSTLDILKHPQNYIMCFWNGEPLFRCENRILIEAAYEMLCWCIENGYVKTNKED